MRSTVRILTPAVLAAAVVSAGTACDRPGQAADAAQTQPAEPHAPAPTNRVAVPAAVRDNLGVTFAKVERRAVGATLRVPGRFELTPEARREYHVPLAGRVELLVKQYDRVEPGQPLFRVDSPEWHRLRLELGEDEEAVQIAAAGLSVAEHTLAEARQTVEALEKRIAALGEAGVRRAELEADLAARRSSLPRLEAEIKAKQAALHSAEHHRPLAMSAAASPMGVTAGFLAETVESAGGVRVPRWQTIEQIEVRAARAGVVESFALSDGAWAEAAADVLTTIAPEAIRFRAVAQQGDLGDLRDGLPAVVVPPARNGAGVPGEPVAGELRIEPVADAEQRTIGLLVTPNGPAPWARPGVSAFMEVTTSDSTAPQTAIPLAAVVQDGLEQVFFRRDPKDPDTVIRTVADLGASDGEWVVAESGVKAGDEVVVAGVYELKLASSNQGGGGAAAAGAGHFHADGTWHAEGTPEPK